MNLFKNRVGRPSNEVLRKRRLFYAAVTGFIVIMLFTSMYTLYNFNIEKLSGATVNNSLTFKNVNNNSFDIYWTSKKGIKTFTVYSSNSTGAANRKIGSHNPSLKTEKSGSWRYGVGGSNSNAILSDSYYLVSAKFKDGKIISELVKTKANSLYVSNITQSTFDVNWEAQRGIENFTVYVTDSKGNIKEKIGAITPKNNQTSGVLKIGEGSGLKENLVANTYYTISAKCKDGKIIKKTFKTLKNSLTSNNITSNSFDIYWNSNVGISSFTIYNSNSSSAVGSKIGTHRPTKSVKKGSWRIGKGGSHEGKILPNQYYLASAKFDDGTVENVLVKTLNEKNTYVIKYDANKGTGTMPNQTITFGGSTALSSNKFTRSGYKFAGWYAWRSQDNKWYGYDKKNKLTWHKKSNIKKYYVYKNNEKVGRTTKPGTYAVMYAMWTKTTEPKKNTYVIKYDANKGTGTMPNQTITFGGSTALSSNKFIRSGYKFVGWYAWRSQDNKWYGYDKDGKLTWHKKENIKKYYIYKNNEKVGRTTKPETYAVMYAMWEKLPQPQNTSKTFSGKKYSLTDKQIKGIARLCEAEQFDDPAGVAAEASLIANRYDLYPEKVIGSKNLFDYVLRSGWWSGAAKYLNYEENNKNPKNKKISPPKEKSVQAVRDVLLNGNRTLPLYIDEHDCINCGDIISIKTENTTISNHNELKKRSNYIKNKTVIYNRYGGIYTFYSFPTSRSDPFGYTDTAIKKIGK